MNSPTADLQARRTDRPVVRTTARWRVLVQDTVRSHRGGMIGWVVASIISVAAIGAGFAAELARSPGGAAEMAAGLEGAAQAMRPLRWPAEHLDTLGGYLTYHNVTLFVFMLGLDAAVQGARAIRGAESAGVLELVLVTGRSRSAVLRDRAIGFAVVATVIGISLGASLALGMALGDAPDVGGSFAAALAVTACTPHLVRRRCARRATGADAALRHGRRLLGGHRGLRVHQRGRGGRSARGAALPVAVHRLQRLPRAGARPRAERGRLCPVARRDRRPARVAAWACGATPCTRTTPSW